jgi:hypothetical protein
MLSSKNLDQIEREYQDQGYSVVEGLFAPEECRAIQSIAESPDYPGTYLPVMNPHRERPALWRRCRMRGWFLLSASMRGKPSACRPSIFLCRPGTRGFSCHQYNYYVQAPKDQFFGLWRSRT